MTPRASTGLGERLAHYRRANGLSAAQLASRTNGELSRAVIANIETGRRSDITIDQMLALAWALGIPPAALVLPLDDPLGGVRVPGYEESDVPTIQALWWFNASNAFRDIRGASPASVIARSRLRAAEELAVSEGLLRRRTNQGAEPDVIEEARVAYEKARAEAVALGMKVPDAI